MEDNRSPQTGNSLAAAILNNRRQRLDFRKDQGGAQKQYKPSDEQFHCLLPKAKIISVDEENATMQGLTPTLRRGSPQMAVR